MKEYTEQEINDLVADIQNTFNSEVQALLKSEEASAIANENRAAQGANSKGLGAQKKTPESAPEMVDDENAENSVAAKAEASGSESSSSPSFSKDEDGGEAPPKKDKAPPEGGGDDAPADDAPPAPAADEGAAPEAPPAQAPEQGAPDMMGQGAPDQMGLEQAYSQLSDEELHAHYDAIKCAVMARMAQGPQMGAAPAAPPAAPPAPAAPAAGGGAPMMMSASEEKYAKLAKASEDKIAELEKQLEGVTKLFEKMLTAPQQKSVTTLAQFQQVAKSEASAKKPVANLSKNEITHKLSKAMSDAKTSARDRDSVNRYFLDGDVEALKDLAHLLQ